MENRNRLHPVILWLITLLVLPFYVKSQEVGSAPHFKVTADLVSSYVWRGSLSTSTPMLNIQPTQAFINGNIDIGFWDQLILLEFTKKLMHRGDYVSLVIGLTI